MKTVISSDRFNRLDFRELLQYKGLLRYLSLRDVKVKYKQTWAGFGWAIIKPFINIVIFGLLSLLIERQANYQDQFLKVSAGIIIWTFISSLITDISNSMSNNANILSKVYFPKLILPASTILVALIDFCISFVIFLVIFIFYKGLPPPTILLLPFVLLGAALVCFAFGLFFGSASVKYRDARFILPFTIQILFYATPVFISSSLVLGFNIPAVVKHLYLINPFYYVVEGFRFCLGEPFFYFSPLHFCISALFVTVFLIISLRYFYRMEQSFVDYL